MSVWNKKKYWKRKTRTVSCVEKYFQLNAGDQLWEESLLRKKVSWTAWVAGRLPISLCRGVSCRAETGYEG